MDNAESWLAFTDLVFVDPVGTGWSRNVKADTKEGAGKGDDGVTKDDGRDPKAFLGINKDLDSLTELMAGGCRPTTAGRRRSSSPASPLAASAPPSWPASPTSAASP